MLRISLLVALVAASWAQHEFKGRCPERPIFENFNVTKYDGRWYEISRYEQRFSLGCDCGFADYTLNSDGSVHVRNCCKRLPNTTLSCTVGKAVVSFPDENPILGKLSVAFRGQEPSVSNYWILDTDYDRFVVVYYCRKVSESESVEAFWLLSRTKVLDQSVVKKTGDYVRRYFDSSAVRVTNQNEAECGTDY